MSSAPQTTSSESKISSSGTTPSSKSSKEGASHQTSGSEVPAKSVSSKSDPASIQTLISTVTSPGGSASSVMLVTTIEAAPSQGSRGETTPTQHSKTENPSTTSTSKSHQSFPSAYIWDAVISSTTSSSTSRESASSTAGAEPYVISSKDGTSIRVFEDFVERLDNSEGKLWTWDVIDTQMYLTNLTAAKAQELKKNHEFIRRINPSGANNKEEKGKEEFRAVGTRDLSSQSYEESILTNTTIPRSIEATSEEPKAKLQP